MVADRPRDFSLPLLARIPYRELQKLKIGSGFFAGADSQVAEVAFRRPLGRTFEISTEGGFSYDRGLQSSNFGAVGATSYKDGFIGTVLRKHLGRTWDAIAAYRFSELQFNAPVTLGGERAERTSARWVRLPSNGIREQFDSNNFGPRPAARLVERVWLMHAKCQWTIIWQWHDAA